MRFEELPPTLLERLGVQREADEVRRRVIFEAGEVTRVSRNTSLSRATRAAYDVCMPPSPVPFLLAAWVVLAVLRCVTVRATARRQIRRHSKVL